MSSGSCQLATGRRAATGSIVALLLSWTVTAVAVAQPDSIFVHCRVFHDLDEDGVRQGGEPGIADVRFTNGVEVLATDALGELDVWVDRALYRFATMTIPAGYWPTTDWYHWVPVGTAGPDTVDFGLRTNPATATDPVHWVHITDTQIKTWGQGHLDDDLLEINELAVPPSFLINTGDIVQVGSDSTHWNNYVSQLAASDFPVLHVVGNHDTLGTSTPMAYYELYVGPPYYSVEVGSWHMMIHNNENAAVGTPGPRVVVG